MSARKLGASWWVDFRLDGVRYRKRSPDNSRSGALAYELVLRQNATKSPVFDSRSKTTFAEFAEHWMETYVSANNKRSEKYAKTLLLKNHLLPSFGTLPLQRIRNADIESYKACKKAKGLKAKSINNHLAVLGKCLNTARDWEFLASVPKIKLLQAVSGRIDFLSLAECRHLLEERSEPLWNGMALAALRTGMRPGELAGLDWSDVDFGNRIITVRRSIWRRQADVPKNGRIRHIPLSDDLHAYLLSRRQRVGYVFPSEDGMPTTDCFRNRVIRRLCIRAGIRHITWYTLRHTFASQMAAQGVPITTIKELMGHSTINMTMRYAHVSPSSLRFAVQVLEQAEKQDAQNIFGQQVGNALFRGAQKIEEAEIRQSLFSAQPT